MKSLRLASTIMMALSLGVFSAQASDTREFKSDYRHDSAAQSEAQALLHQAAQDEDDQLDNLFQLETRNKTLERFAKAGLSKGEIALGGEGVERKLPDNGIYQSLSLNYIETYFPKAGSKFEFKGGRREFRVETELHVTKICYHAKPCQVSVRIGAVKVNVRTTINKGAFSSAGEK